MKDFKKHLKNKGINLDLRKQGYIPNKNNLTPVFNINVASVLIGEVNSFYGTNMGVQRLQTSSLKQCIELAESKANA